MINEKPKMKSEQARGQESEKSPLASRPTPHLPQPFRGSTPYKPLLLSILAAIVTFAIKGAAFFLTDSVSLFSDAIESVVNLQAALIALVCLWYAKFPVDSTHTYGHEKIEYFSSGLEGVLILVAAGGIAWYAIQRLLDPHDLNELGWGTALALAASVINFIVAQVLLRAGRVHGSIVLEADGQHLMTDVWTGGGVIVGLVVVSLFPKWHILDPLIALALAANIVRTAVDLLRRSFNGLMDHSLPAAEQAQVRAAIARVLPKDLFYHALRTRQAGTRRFTDFHLLVPGSWSVKKAHDLAMRLENAVCTALPGIEVAIHIEPIEEKASWEDSELLAIEKSDKQ
jgi:cation diffusion facilitator family transporter